MLNQPTIEFFYKFTFFVKYRHFWIISAAFEGTPILDIPTVALLRIHFFAFFGVKDRGDRQGNLSRKSWRGGFPWSYEWDKLK